MIETPQNPEDARDESLSKGCKAVRQEIEKQGFVDYYFVGKNIYGERISTFSIGHDDARMGKANCTAIDNMVGAMVRQIIDWQVGSLLQDGTLEGGK